MTQKSYFWGGTSVGDATLAPYDDDEFSDVIAALIQLDRTIQGVLYGHGDNLLVSNPSGLTIRIATGKAVVDGKLYDTDAAVDLTMSSAPGSGTDYYNVILRKDFIAQTVRAVLVGPVNGGPATPVVQNDGVIWEEQLAEVTHTSAEVITVYNRRVPILSNGAIWREEGTDFGAISKTISDIPAGYKHLRLKILLRGDLAGAISRSIALRFNGDTGNNYSDNRWDFRDTGVSATTTSAARNNARINGHYYEAADALIMMSEIDIFQDGLGYATLRFVGEGGQVAFHVASFGNGTWMNTNEITSITIMESTGAAALVTDYYQITLYAVP